MSTDEPQTLREVAQAALDNNSGASGRELDRMAKKMGLKIVYTTINAIASGSYKSRPSRQTLEALADLSGYKVEQVYAAARMPLPMKPLSEELPPDADLLNGQQRRLVIDAIRLFAQQNRELAMLHSEREDGEEHADGSAANKQPTRGGDNLGSVSPFRKLDPWENDIAAREDPRVEKNRPGSD